MIPVLQRVIEKGSGDCLAACIASILELSLDEVPNFNQDPSGDAHGAVERFLRPRGMVMVVVHTPHEPRSAGLVFNPYHATGVYFIASVDSQRFPDGRHAVVAQYDRAVDTWVRIVHDPNPHNKPYPSDVFIHAATFLVSLNPHLTPCASTS